jgi:biotin transport system substrate-specific component
VFLGPRADTSYGFIAAAFVTGKIVRSRPDAGLVWLVFAMLAGTAVVYALGVLQLVLVGKLSLEKAAVVGVLPFLPGDALKIAAASVITLKVRDRIQI